MTDEPDTDDPVRRESIRAYRELDEAIARFTAALLALPPTRALAWLARAIDGRDER